MRVTAFALLLVQIIAAGSLRSEDGGIVLEIATVVTSSERVDVEISVVGLSPEPWSPIANMGIGWDADALEFQDAKLHPAISHISNPVDVLGAPDEAVAIIDVRCSWHACWTINPEPEQPILMLTFKVRSVFSSTPLHLFPAYEPPWQGSTVVFDRRGDPIRPVLVDGAICLRRFIRGDFDENRDVNLSDVLGILRFLFVSGERPVACGDFADVTDDGRVDISDAIYLAMHMFLGGPEPSPPGQPPGLDPTADDLLCVASSGCGPE
jgi:hypothetical protein